MYSFRRAGDAHNCICGTDFTTIAFDGVVTVTGDKLNWSATYDEIYGGPYFNGFDFVISGTPSITPFNLGHATNNYSAGGLLLGGNEVLMDVLLAVSGQQTVFDLNFGAPVPEPSSWLLALAGFAGLSFVRRRPAAAACL